MFTDDRPIFMQLADALADDILRGRYTEGEAVPSTNELAAFYRINPATAGKAVNRLVEIEVLEKRRGVGMFVAAGALQALRALREGAFIAHYIRPLVDEADVLRLTESDIIRMIRTERNPS